MAVSELNRRRWRSFRRNRRAWWSLWIFALLFVLSLFAEFIANDKPIVVSFDGALYWPIWHHYPETTFGGDFQTEADYRDPVVRCLIRTAGNLDGCFDEADGFTPEAPYIPLGQITQRGGKIVRAWAFEGDCDPAALRSATAQLEWPPHSGRHIDVPEVDRVAFFTLEDARRVINVAQAELLDRLILALQ